MVKHGTRVVWEIDIAPRDIDGGISEDYDGPIVRTKSGTVIGYEPGGWFRESKVVVLDEDTGRPVKIDLGRIRKA